MTLRRTIGLLVSLLTIGACSSNGEVSGTSSTVGVVVVTTETLTAAVIPSTTVPATVPSTSTIVSTTTTTSAPAQVPLPNTELFDAAIKLHTLDAGSRDVSTAVIFDGQVVHTFAASSSKSSRAVNDESGFRIASISKVVTAETVLELIDQGLLQLDAPIVGRIADNIGLALFDDRARNITVKQLLSHTSGISNFLKIFFDAGSYDQMGMLTEVLGQPLATEPGSTYKYSNVNFILLGKAIELVTGLSYQDAAKQLVLSPLGLQSFRMVGTYEFGPTDALHAVSGGRTYMEQLGAAGAWVATASDVAKLLDSLNPDSPTQHLVSRELMDLMKVPATPVPADPLWDYGLGLRLFTSGEWGHSGSVENVHAMVVHRPDGLVVSVLVNGTKPKETDDLIGAINDAVLAARTGVAATTTVAP
ncbi:MAG: serine hydrolase domain-containing protein [Actinomycetes bacterium]